jgi:hypothetical protein
MSHDGPLSEEDKRGIRDLLGGFVRLVLAFFLTVLVVEGLALALGPGEAPRPATQEAGP